MAYDKHASNKLAYSKSHYRKRVDNSEHLSLLIGVKRCIVDYSQNHASSISNCLRSRLSLGSECVT